MNLSHQILWGEYGPGDAGQWTPFAAREESIGRTFDIYHKFASFDTTFSGHTEWLAAANAGRKIAITWEATKTAGLEWATIRDGGVDDYITTQINYLTANYPSNVEIIIRFGHEMNANWYPWNPGYNGGTIRCHSVQEYKDTWVHVRELVRSLNPNIKFWWCPNVKDTGRAQVNILTPTCAGTANQFTITIPSDPGITIGDCVFEVDSNGYGLPEAQSRVGTDTRVQEINGLTLTVSIKNKSNFTNARLGFAHMPYPMEDFYPGDDYVDYVGFDSYNALEGSSIWFTATQIVQGYTVATHPMQPKAYDRVVALAATAPVWIGETGCSDYDPTGTLLPHKSGTNNPCPSTTAKASFYTSLFTLDKDDVAPRLGAICFYDRPKDWPYSYTDTGSLYWAHDSSASAWAAFISNVSGFAQEQSPSMIAAIRALIIDTEYFNARVFLRRAPENGTLPYVTIIPNMSTAPALTGDGAVTAFARQFSVDIWQKESAENDSIPVAVRNALDGAKIDLGTGRAWTIRVEGSDDIPEPSGTNIVHHTLTCSLKHDRSAL